jgi:hypothetical protein
MTAIIDLLCAFILGGVILATVLSANDNAVENHYVVHGDMLVQELLLGTVPMIESEFRNMGFGTSEDQTTVLQADSSSITFLTCQSYGGSIDTVRYFVGDTTELRATQNQKDRYLHRRVNSSKVTNVGVVTYFKLAYCNQVGEVLPTPVPLDRLSEVYTLEITMEVQNPYALYRKHSTSNSGEPNALYSKSFWQETVLTSRNVRR